MAPALSPPQELSAPDPSSSGENGTAFQRLPSPRSGAKLAQVVEPLQQDRGASIAELIVLTGWLPHKTRAALTGLRKRGFVTALDPSDKKRGSIYRVETRPDAEYGAAAHSGVAQADVAPPSKTMRREAKPKARRSE
jgi:Protein of unknown function (DUF3489)